MDTTPGQAQAGNEVSETSAISDEIKNIRENVWALRLRLSSKMRRKIARLAKHVNGSEQELLENLLFEAAQAETGAGSHRTIGLDVYQQLWLILEENFHDEIRTKRFERKFIHPRLKHAQKIVRPTWAGIFVERLSGEACALWVELERDYGQSVHLPFELKDAVYLSDAEFRVMEQRLLVPHLKKSREQALKSRLN